MCFLDPFVYDLKTGRISYLVQFFLMGTGCPYLVCMNMYIVTDIDIWFIELVYGCWYLEIYFFELFDIKDVDIQFVELVYRCQHSKLFFFFNFLTFRMLTSDPLNWLMEVAARTLFFEFFELRMSTSSCWICFADVDIWNMIFLLSFTDVDIWCVGL